MASKIFPATQNHIIWCCRKYWEKSTHTILQW